MLQKTRLDVLIVYNHKMATSANNRAGKNKTPFLQGSSYDTCNTAYAYFLEMCAKNNLVAGFTSSLDITGPGTCGSYWTYSNELWTKHLTSCYSKQIFDKFAPLHVAQKTRRSLLFSSKQVKPYNSHNLYNLFFDKFKTFQKLSEYTIPTVALQDRTVQAVEVALNQLDRLLHKSHHQADYDSRIILKDRFGAGGNHVYQFSKHEIKNIIKVLKQNPEVKFIIQPYLKFDKGFVYDNQTAATDIRLVYLNGKIVQVYIRRAKPHDFRCNEHQGGTSTYIALSQVPVKILALAKTVNNLIKSDNSLYALDFMISNNGNAYFLEGNTGPGLNWNTNVKSQALQPKKLIRLIVKDLKMRIISNDLSQKLTLTAPPTTLPTLSYISI